MADNKNEAQSSSPRIRIGGAWLKSNSWGKYYSLSVTKAELDKVKRDSRGNIQILMYKAKEKNNENSPDFNLFGFPDEAVPTPAKAAPAKPAAKSATSAAKPTSKPKPLVDDEPVEPAEPLDEDLF